MILFQIRHVQIAFASDPLFRPLHTQRADQAFTSLFIGEDLDHISPSFDLSVESFQKVGRTDAPAMRFWEVEAGQTMDYIPVYFVHDIGQYLFIGVHHIR